MRTYIVIPHYIVTDQLKQLAINTIKSFRKTSKNAIIISVDDGSPMDCTFLKEISDIYLKNKENSGFGITCNNGFRYVKWAESNDCYIVCANNDIEVFKRWQQSLMEPFAMFNKVGITGLISNKMRNIDGVSIENYYKNKITEGGMLDGWMQSGGLWMSKKSVLDKIGLFDEQFIRGGYEDVDLFLRCRDKFGYKIIMSARSMFWHKEGATRWNCEQNNYINNFGRESKSIEQENLQKFLDKWSINPHVDGIWQQKEILN